MLVAKMVLAIIVAATLGLAPAWARDVVVAAGQVPPQVNEDGTGREATIIRDVLSKCGYGVVFKVVPFSRHWAIFKSDPGIDAVSTVPEGMVLGGAPTVNHVDYQNGALTLTGKGGPIRSLDDLAGKRVITFAGGTKILPGVQAFGPKFKELREYSDQLAHSKMLFAGHVDAVLADGLIFAEYSRRLQERGDGDETLTFDAFQPVTFTPIFPPTHYHLEFRDAGLRDQFDRCYHELKASGQIDQINKSWIDPYRAIVGDRYLGQ